MRTPIKCAKYSALIVVCLAFFVACGTAAVSFGTKLDGRAAPDFTLTDFRGDTLRLSELQGRAVALTFIYTHCPDVCLLTVENFRLAYESLSPETREKVALVAVTVDPERDTVEQLAAFSAAHGLDAVPSWYAVTGTRSELEPVWREYWIDPGTMLLRSAQPGGTLLDASPAAGASPTDGLLAHTDAIFLIDPSGRERFLGRSDADPENLAAALAALANE